MNKKVFVEYLSNVNTVIKQPLRTQRIKFTCFDVSQNYIVFGATSGGIYIFNRYPCKFIKLLPNKEGNVTNITISLDETTVAITTIKGLIVIIQNSFLDHGIKYQTYKEHEGRNITVLKWHVNELYVGDDFGKITVISIPFKTVKKSLFNIPSATLMTLDSSLVQIDTFSNYLLASTKTRSYLCDTDKEQYRQIGKKPRDGYFGAIFCIDDNKNLNNLRKEDNFLYLNDNKSNGKCEVRDDVKDNVKIYCARPGCRIWEAKFDGSVICTHQFKESLNQNVSSIIHVNNNENLKLNISQSINNPIGFNFSKIFLINNFILSFQEDAIYIFDINSDKLLFSTNYFTGIKDIKILDNSLYIWCGKHYLRILYLTDIEDLVNVTLSKKQYRLCSEFCLSYKSEILSLLSNGKLNNLKILKNKIDSDLLDDFKEILKHLNKDKVNKKLKNGIYVVNKPQNELKNDIKNDTKNVPIINSEETKEINPNIPKNLQNNDDKSIEILYNQYQINKINNLVDTPKYLTLISNLDNFINLYEPFINLTLEKNEKESENELKTWFFNSTLKYLSKNYTTKIFKYLENEKVLLFIKDAFILTNTNMGQHSCLCSFPFPTAKNQCHYYNVGCEVLNKYSNKEEILNQVPYMFKYILMNNEDLNLPLLIQYGDVDIFLSYLKAFTYDIWDEACKLFIKLKSNVCLNCDCKFGEGNKTDLTWTQFGEIMLKSLNATSTVNLLMRYSERIENGELDEEFYQMCILTSCLQSNGSVPKEKSGKLIERIKENNIEEIVGRFLSKKSSGGFMSNGVVPSQYYCTVCDVPKMPILDEFIRLKCGHISHKICSVDLNRCKRCDQS